MLVTSTLVSALAGLSAAACANALCDAKASAPISAVFINRCVMRMLLQ
ncbi:hypothetical protein XOC_0054 [Xanthomonas oryzae pv. oryzicola BLS256]|uniref:Lipoprotein n=1 Tax=Xanthomonas oryzae pv. oryzicola (strain BLS256) TaxID=383407 RepID=G7THY2_XANOB|nr:hypothetical protein XOC_0054 [Xanthomonas oryzae pv. oryzicola BLS256]QEO95024.1 hypothetical protein XOCgx_0028 [Xanthomonas oryzae pv. oryzicola]